MVKIKYIQRIEPDAGNRSRPKTAGDIVWIYEEYLPPQPSFWQGKNDKILFGNPGVVMQSADFTKSKQ